jgi:hypothetical protein
MTHRTIQYQQPRVFEAKVLVIPSRWSDCTVGGQQQQFMELVMAPCQITDFFSRSTKDVSHAAAIND